MDRREFLKSTGVAAAVLATAKTASAGEVVRDASAAHAVVSGAKDIRVASSWPDKGQGPADSARRLMRRIEIATEGRYRFHIVATEKSGASAVAAGEAEAYHASEHDNLDVHRGFAYFAGLPGQSGLRPSGLEAWMLAGGGQDLWDELAAEHGVKALVAGHTGRSTGLWSSAPIASINELAGRKIWAMGLAREVVRGVGADPSPLSAPELERALAAGEVAAAEAGGAVASFSLGILQHAKIPVPVSINHMGTALSLGFKREVWDAMSRGDQAIISAICSAELHTAIAEEKAHRHHLLAAVGKPRRSDEPARELASAISRISDAVVAHLAASDPRTERISQSYSAFRRALGIRPLVLEA